MATKDTYDLMISEDATKMSNALDEDLLRSPQLRRLEETLDSLSQNGDSEYALDAFRGVDKKERGERKHARFRAGYTDAEWKECEKEAAEHNKRFMEEYTGAEWKEFEKKAAELNKLFMGGLEKARGPHTIDDLWGTRDYLSAEERKAAEIKELGKPGWFRPRRGSTGDLGKSP